MPKNDAQLNVGVKYNVDQNSVNTLKKSLQDLQKIKLQDFSGSANQLGKLRDSAKLVEMALLKAFNVNLGSLNLLRFSSELGLTSGKVSLIYTNFSRAGAVGKAAFTQLTGSILTTKLELQETSGLITKMGLTMMNTVKWGIASSVMNSFTGSVRQAFDYVKSLDSALNDIRIVTKQSTDLMANFAAQANNAAQSLGRSTMDYTKAALTFYQQGLSLADVQARTEATLKAQNITGAGELMADYLTAVWNGYKVANEEAELYVDKLAAVADSSASNMSLLAVAMSKVASSANLLGVPVDKLNAQIATITATTRQAPESVGNALKTIYSRINDIATGADDALISLGNYSSKMLLVGINVLDANGKLRDTGDVIDEIGAKWLTLSHEQQIYLARTMAGQRQYNNLLALFENWGKYSDLVNVSMEAQGATALKNAIYMESLAAKMEQLGAAGERVKAALVDEEDLKGIVLSTTGIVNLLASFIEGIGGGTNAILALGSIATQVFSGVIAKELNNVLIHFQNISRNNDLMKQEVLALQAIMNSKGYEDDSIRRLTTLKQASISYYNYMTLAQRDQHNQLIMNIAEEEAKVKVAEERAKGLKDFAKSYAQVLHGKGYGDIALGDKAFDSDAFKEIAGKRALEINEKIKEVAAILLPLKIKGIDNTKEIQAIITKIKPLITKLEGEFGKSINQIEGYDTLNASWEKLVKNMTDGNTEAATSNLRNFVNEYVNFLKNAAIKNEAIANGEIKKVGDEADYARQRLLNARLEEERFRKQVKQQINVQTFVKVLAGVGQVASGFRSLINLTNVWKNENISTGEKVLQTISSITMALPMMINGFSQVGAGLAAMHKGVLAFANAQDIAAARAVVAAGVEASSAEAVAAAEKVLLGQYKKTGIAAWASLGPFLPVVVGVTLAIGGLVAATYTLYKAWHKERDAAKDATEQAQKLKQEYDDIKTSYNLLKSSILNYNSAQDAIKLMTKGTQEWRDAIRESNDAVLELIKNYPELKDYITDVNGQLILSLQGQKIALEKRAKEVNIARLASVNADSFSREANLRANIEAGAGLSGSNFRTADSGRNLIVSNITPRVDLIEAIVKAYAQTKTTLDENERIKLISKLSGVALSLTRAILLDTKNIDLLVTQLLANEAASKLAYLTMASENLQLNRIYQGFDLLGQLIANVIGGRILLVETQREELRLAKLDTADIVELYYKATGQSLSNTGDNSFSVNGLTYARKLVLSIIAATNALLKLGNAADTTAQLIKDANKTGSGLGIQSFVAGGDFSNLTEDLVKNLHWGTLLMVDFFNTYYKLAGFESGKAFQEAYHAAIIDSKDRFKNIGKQYLEPVQEAVKLLPNVALGIKEKLAKSLNDAFISGGTLGLHQLQKLFSQVDELDFDALSSILLGIDWTQDGAVYLLKNAIELQGIEVGLTSKEWETFILHLDKTMTKSYDAASAIDKLRNTASQLKDLNTGDILDNQAYQDLIELKPELKDLFKISDDGYMFIGKQLQVAEALKNTTELTIKELKLMQSVAEEVAAADIGTRASLINIELLYTTGSSKNSVFTSDLTQLNNLTEDLAFQNALLYSGVSKLAFDKAKEFILLNTYSKILSEGLLLEYQEAKNTIQQALDLISSMQINAEEGIYEESLREAQELTATRSQSLEELRNHYYNELILLEDYIDMREVLVEKEVENLGITREEYDNTFNLLSDHLEETSTSFKKLSKAEKTVELDQLTLRVYLLGDALDDLKGISSDTFDDIQYAINNKLNVDAVEGFSELKTTLSEIFQTDIDTSFIQENFDLIRQLALGDVTALGLLQAKLGQDYIAKIAAEADIPATDAALLAIQGLVDATKLNDLPLGISLDDAGFTDAIQKFAYMAGMSALEINELLGQIGFEPDVSYQDIPVNDFNMSEQNGHYVYSTVNPDGSRTYMNVDDYLTTSESGQAIIRLPIINGKKTKFAGGINAGNFASPPKAPSGGGGTGGGGGKGSSPKQSTPSIAKPNTTKIKRTEQKAAYDPYLQIDKQLERQSDLLDDLEDKEKHLSGAERYKNLQEQNKELEKQALLLQLRIRINRQDAGLENTSAWFAQRLKNTFKDVKNLFDDDGKLTDENSLRKKLVDMYNKRTSKAEKAFKDAQKDYNDWIENVWNKQSKDWQESHKALKEKKDQELKTAEETAKNSLKSAEDWYKQNLDYIENYKKALEEAAKDEAELQKIRLAIVDNQIANFLMKVDLAIDIGDFERDWLEFEKKFVKKIRDDDIFGQALYDSKRFQSYFDSSEITARAQQIADLRKQIAEMLAGSTGSIYGYEGTLNRLAEARERLQKLLEDQMKDYEELQEIAEDMMDHYLDALDDAKDKMDEHVDQYERVNSLIEHNVKLTQLLYGDKAYDTMDKYYDMQKSNNETILQTLRAEQLYWQNMLANEQVGSDAWKNIKQHLDLTTDDLNSKLEDMIENLSDQWLNRVNGIIDKLNNALTGGRGTSYLDEEWDYINKWDDTFLDPVESRMGINEIQSLYQLAVDGLSGSPKQQQKMNKLMSDQLKLLREKDNLTQYDLDRAKAALEVEKARLALEDSRMNKNRMRLRRDSQGNYTYQYVADEEKLDDLQKQLSDAEANLYNMDKEHYKETLNDLYDTYKDYLQKRTDLAREYNATEDELERARIQGRIDLLDQWYGKYYDSVAGDSKFTEDLYLRYSTAIGLGLDYTKYTAEELHDIVDQMVPQAGSAILELRETVAGEGGLLESTKDAMKSISDATKEYDLNVKDLLEKAGTSLLTISQVTDAYGNALDKNITQAQEITGYYADMVNKSVEAVENVKNLLDVIEQGLNSIDPEFIKTMADAASLVMTGMGAGQEVDENGNKVKLVDTNLPTFNTDLEQAMLNTRLSDISSSDLQNYLASQAASHSLDLVSQSLENLADLDINDLAEEDLNGVVNTIKGITSYLGNFAAQGLDSLMKEASSYIGTIDNVEHLDQNVHIEAHFPNVVNHTEIEAAINNLVNIASQKASTNAG